MANQLSIFSFLLLLYTSIFFRVTSGWVLTTKQCASRTAKSFEWQLSPSITIDQLRANELSMTSSSIDEVFKPSFWRRRKNSQESEIKNVVPEENIAARIEDWARTTDGLLYNPTLHTSLSSVLYQNVLGETILCNSSNVLGCLSQFWNSMKVFIEQEYKFLPRNIALPESSSVQYVQWIAFPNCFQRHQDMESFKAIIDFACKDHVAHIGNNQFSFKIYHPDQLQESNRGIRISPLAPYPILALELKPGKQAIQIQSYTEQRMQQLYQLQSDIESSYEASVIIDVNEDSTDEDFEDSFVSNLVNHQIVDLAVKKNKIREVYNSEAVDATPVVRLSAKYTNIRHYKIEMDDKPNEPKMLQKPMLRIYYRKYHHYNTALQKYDNFSEQIIGSTSYNEVESTSLDSSLSLLHNFQLECRLRDRTFTNDEVIGMSSAWIQEQIEQKNTLFVPIDNEVKQDASSLNLDNDASLETKSIFGVIAHRISLIKGNKDSSIQIEKMPKSDEIQNTDINRIKIVVSNEKVGEYVYGDLWKEIYELNEEITRNIMVTRDKKFSFHNIAENIAEYTKKNTSNKGQVENLTDDKEYTLHKWMNALTKPRVELGEESNTPSSIMNNDVQHVDKFDHDLFTALSNQIDKWESNDNNTKHKCDGSLMFVAPNTYSFNAEAFKRLATSLQLELNQSLKIMTAQNQEHAPKANYYLEVFHPEYVSTRKGYDHNLRRSPFPMIQICYEILK